MSRFRDDPRWITAKFAGQCAKTGQPFNKGDRVFYYPRTRQCYAGEAAEQAAREFEAAAMDEDVMSGGIY